MKILMLLESEFPHDERVEKEIESLIKKGFSVEIATYTFLNKPAREKYNNYIIHRRKISRIVYKSSAASLILPFYFRFWYFFADTILRNGDFHIVHVHDLPLTHPAFRLACKYNLLMVCDQHEYYSNWIRRTRHYNTMLGKIINLFSNWAQYERKYLRKADLVLTVEDSLREIYISQVGIEPSKICTLPNTPSIKVFDSGRTDPEIARRYKDRFVLFYAGGLDQLRGIEFICKSLTELRNQIPEVLFLVAGKENRSFSLHDLIRKYNVENLVDFVGWVPLNQLSSYMVAAHVCLFVPKADNLEINNTIVTKIFQYVAMGKPVIVSEARRMKEFVESNGLGFSVPYGNVAQLCEVILLIRKEPSITKDIVFKGKRIAGLYSWEITSLPFLQAYSELKPRHDFQH